MPTTRDTDTPRDPDTLPDREMLRTNLQALAARLGKTPTAVELNDHGDIHPKQYVEAFGGWDAALAAAGLDPAESAHKIPDHELLAELHRLYTILDQSPSQQDMREHGEYSDNVYKLRFGSWNEALQAAMLDTNDISDVDLLRELERVASDLGMVPTAEEMAEHGTYAPVTYHRRFGSWRAALSKAEFSEL